MSSETGATVSGGRVEPERVESRFARFRRYLDEMLSDPAMILVFVIVIAVAAVWTYRGVFGDALSGDRGHWGQFGDFLGGLLNPVIGFFTLVALIVTVQHNIRLVKASVEQTDVAAAERRFNASKDALASAAVGFESAVSQLKVAGNDRVKWISAARLIATAQKLREAVSEPVHLHMLEIVIEQTRQSVMDLLGYDDALKSGAFFYGSPLNPKGQPTLAIDDAAKASSVGKRLVNIPEEAIWEFWSFAQFPKDYEDALSVSGMTWDADDTPSAVMWPGVFQYLRHRRVWRSIGGNLVPKKPAAP